MRFRILAALGVAAALVGCHTTPLKLDGVTEGHWRAKALVKDIEQSRSYIVHLNFNAVRGQVVRMDVTSSIGTGVASLLTTEKEVRYILFDAKKFYYGSPQPGVMRPILSIPFDPRWLHNILFDIPFTGRGWSCAKDGDGNVKNCSESSTGLKITWSGRQGEKKVVLIEHPKASVQINIQSFKAKVEERKNLFSLEAPESFQKLHVR